MDNRQQGLMQANYFLKPGFIYISKTPTLISAVLGSCVAVAVYDRKRQFGGMNHFQFPVTRNAAEATARFGNVATLALVRSMLQYGSKAKHLEAQILGGAHDPEVCNRNIGHENISTAVRVLQKMKVKSVSQDVGGQKGRKVVYNTSTNEMVVMKVDRLRESDWFPYEGER